MPWLITQQACPWLLQLPMFIWWITVHTRRFCPQNHINSKPMYGLEEIQPKPHYSELWDTTWSNQNHTMQSLAQLCHVTESHSDLRTLLDSTPPCHRPRSDSAEGAHNVYQTKNHIFFLKLNQTCFIWLVRSQPAACSLFLTSLMENRPEGSSPSLLLQSATM